MQTMSQVKHLYLSALLMMAPAFSAQADCPETPAGAHVFLGADLTVPVYFSDRPEIRELELLRVQLAWVPNDEETRYRDQYVIDVDWVQQTSSDVHIWDGEMQAIREHDAYPAKLSQIDPETGQIQLTACDTVFWSAGPALMFAYYGLDGEIYHEFTRVSPVTQSSWVTYEAVTNEEVSSFISDTFNRGLDQQIITDVTKATGVEPGHYLAQSLLFQTLEPSVHQFGMNPSRFFDATNAVVNQNRVYVTGNEASARVPLSVKSILSNGLNIREPGGLARNLEDYPGIIEFQGGGGGYNLVFDARPDIEIETEPCVDGRTRITADFVYPSELESRILLYIEDSPEPMVREPTLDKGVYCDRDYRVYGQRIFEGKSVSTDTIWVPVATKGVLVKVFYALKHHQGETVSPPAETVLEIWGATDIESLYGTRKFYCDKPGGDEVDSVDEIAYRRSRLLSDEQKAGFGPFDDVERNEAAWADGDGDGSICNGGELGEDGDGEIIESITLSVFPSTQ